MSSKHWVFTLNNPHDGAEDTLRERSEDPEGFIEYLIFGRETAPTTGTRHLQGYVCFNRRTSLSRAKDRLALGAAVHLERKRGTVSQAITYCKKDGDFVEYGNPPSAGGAGSDSKFTQVKEFALAIHADEGRAPTPRELANEFPGLFVRYGRALAEFVRHVIPPPVLQEGTLRLWQATLKQQLSQPADDRTVRFVVDPAGGTGKTWFQRYMVSQYPTAVQILSVGKRDDVAHAISEAKRIFLFNVPRGGMEFLQYTCLEQLKDRMVFSPKYDSRTKILSTKVHVVVFCNEHPDMNRMSADRYSVTDLRDN